MLLNEKAAPYEKEYRVKRHSNKSIKNIFLKSDHRFNNYMGLNFRNADFTGEDLSFSDLRNADFSYACLRGANLSYCSLKGAIFDYANCYGVNFTESDPENASFYKTVSESDALSDSVVKPNLLVSIYMPTWNREELAKRAVESILKQEYENWELIIVDDFSPNYLKLQGFIEDLADPRIKYIRNDYNSGACAVRNQAIKLANGFFITGIDDDDEWLPNRLTSFLKEQHKLNQHAFLYADDYICDASGYLSLESLRLYPKPDYNQQLFNKKNIVGNQVFTLTSRLQTVLFDTQLAAAQDYDAFYRLAEQYGGPFKLKLATQILYVNHGEVRITASRKKFSGYFSFYKKHSDKFDKTSKKYQLFTLYYIRKKPMSFRVFRSLLCLRNVKRYMMLQTVFKDKKF